jgi:hypothetical protein
MMRTSVVNRIARTGLVALVAAAASGCGDTVRSSRSPSYLFIQSLTAASGAEPEDDSDELSSDVLTNGGVFEDLGTVTFRLAVKDIGQQGNNNAPSPNNLITVNRYTVNFRRTDGRNTPGVDVPYPFEGAGTVTVTTNATSMSFVLVRIQAKLESPLANLRGAGGAIAISTIADITFYGKDQAGNDTQVTGSISVNFADWADPKN